VAGVLDKPFSQLTPLSGVAVQCTLGYNEFDFFLENEEYRPLMGAKLKSKTHLQNTFLRVWLQSLKKALICPKNFTLISNLLKKLLKMNQKKVISKTSLTNMSKSEKSAYFRHLVHFSNLFRRIQNQREILRFLIPVLNF
jgi:hypothetical protein